MAGLDPVAQGAHPAHHPFGSNLLNGAQNAHPTGMPGQVFNPDTWLVGIRGYFGGVFRARALSDLMESGRRLYLFVFTQFPSRQMISFG
jgi:hypothetical protein